MCSSYRCLSLTLVLSMVLTVMAPPLLHLRAQAPLQAHFGSDILLLTLGGDDDNALIAPMVMSLSGRYVAGVTLSEMAPAVYLWDIAQFTQQSSERRVTPSGQVPLRPLLRDHKAFYNALIAFSPDERYLAVMDDVSIKLLTTPELQEALAISVDVLPVLNQPVWSSDGQLLASVVSEGMELVVWNTQTNAILRRTLDATYSRNMTYIGGEWILTAISGSTQHPNAFAVCTRLLEECTSYLYPGVVDSIASRATVLVSHRVDEQSRYVIGIWTRRGDGVYLLNEERLNDNSSLCLQPRALSPTGRYLFCDGTNGERIVWDLFIGEITQRLPAHQWSPLWVDEDTLVTKSFSLDNELLLNLYRIGFEGDVFPDELNLRQIGFPALYDLIDPERFAPVAVGNNGLMLVTLGYGALLIPIVYE